MGIRPRRRYQTVAELYAALYKEKAIETEAEETGAEGMAAASLAGGALSCRDEEEAGKAKWINIEFSEKRDGSRKAWRGIYYGMAAALGLILLWAAICYQSGRFPFGRTANDLEAVSRETGGIAKGAVRLENGRAEDFLLLLADDEVLSIQLADCFFRLTEPLEIRKPVYVTGDSVLDIPCLLTVGGDGRLFLEGARADIFQLYVADGGAVTVASGAVLSAGCVWAWNKGAITIRDGAAIRSGMDTFFDTALLWEKGGALLWPGEELFADARHVATEEEYHVALLKEKAVIIEGDLELSAESLPPQSIPVQIAKGATVTISGELSYRTGAVLVNYGSIKGSLRYEMPWGEGVMVVNYGAICADMVLPNNSRLINYGIMQIPEGRFIWSEVINTGEILVGKETGQADMPSKAADQEADYLDLIGKRFYNYGKLSIKNMNARNPRPVIVRICIGENFYNGGTIHIGQYGRLKNESYLDNSGVILCTEETGGLQNQGQLSILDKNGMLDLGHHAAEYNANTGLLICDTEVRIDCPAGFQDGRGREIRLNWSNADHCIWVMTPEEFFSAMEDESRRTIVVNTDMEFPGKLTITKGVAVMDGCTLSVGELEVKGEEAFLYCAGSVDLNGGGINSRRRRCGHCSRDSPLRRDCGRRKGSSRENNA